MRHISSQIRHYQYDYWKAFLSHVRELFLQSDSALCHASEPSTSVANLHQRPAVRRPADQLSLPHERTQFVEGISVTLKSTLRVTQDHWKRNHWTDHTRLTVRRVIGRWILSWPWNVGHRSLKVIETSAIRKLGCSFLFAKMSNMPNVVK